jgi:bacteriorhodopsin
MFLTTLTFGSLAWRMPTQKRLFHLLLTFITAIATLSYFAQASGSGYSFVHRLVVDRHKHNIPDTTLHVLRQVFWVRWVDWVLTTPLTLLTLAFIAGIDGANILVALFANAVMVLTGLFFARAHTDGQRWGWYAMSCVAYLVVVHQLVLPGRRAVVNKDRKIAQLYAAISGFSIIVWALYPIVWAIGDGSRKWSVDAQIIALAVVDLLAKPVFGFWLLFTYTRFTPAIEGFWTHGLSSEGAVHLDDDNAA